MKLWGGRFSNQTDKLVEHFNASIGFDQELYHYDIEGSKVHVRMLARCGIISSEEAEILVKGLSEVEKDIEEGRVEFSESLEDIHTLVEVQLTEKVGKVGGKLHIARSRNDQVALDMRLYMRDKINMLQNELLRLMQGLLDLAADHKDTIMPGYTHLQKAQPVTLGHHLLAYYFKFKRDYERLEDNLKRVNITPWVLVPWPVLHFPLTGNGQQRNWDLLLSVSILWME